MMLKEYLNVLIKNLMRDAIGAKAKHKKKITMAACKGSGTYYIIVV